jgi:hypothetical protein
MRTAMTLNRNTTQKPLTAKPSVETGTKRTSQFNKKETTEKKPEQESLEMEVETGKADEKCTRIQNGKRKQGLLKAP